MKYLLPAVFLSYYNCILLQAKSASQPMPLPERLAVPEHLTDWSKPHPSYHPPKWTAVCSFEQCDPETPSFLHAVKFNKKDGGVDRRMARRITLNRPTYVVSHGLPLNPSGRTGLAGRGLLPRWGPSHLVKVILVGKRQGRVAFLKTNDGISLKNDPFATFVANLSSNKLSDRVVSVIENSELFRDKKSMAEKVLRKAEESAIKVVADTMPSPLDTDNAWVELSVYVIPCRKVRMFCEAVVKDKFIAANHEWSVDTDQKSLESKLESLKRLNSTAKGNSLNRQVSRTRSELIDFLLRYGRPMSLGTTLFFFSIGVILAFTGFPVIGFGIIIGTCVAYLLYSLADFILSIYAGRH
uniref:ADP-ribose pyrophosphatase, mitochondrial n=1 Tax=Trichuris muris TaxID=70415 RepID=A0A5S6QQB9_TRIMR